MGGKEQLEVMRDVLNELVVNINFMDKRDRELLQEVSEKMDELINQYLYKNVE